MAVNTGAYLKRIYNNVKKLGDKSVSSDAVMIIDGFEDLSLLVKQFPWPVLTPQGEIEVPTPLGGAFFIPQQLDVHQQGAITIHETRDGAVAKMLEQINVNGGTFNATCYEGLPEDHTRRVPIYDCFMQIDKPDRDHENRGALTEYTGTLFYHFFGDDA